LADAEYHMSIYLSREIRRRFEELKEDRNGKSAGNSEFVRNLQHRLGMGLDQMITVLNDLEESLDAQDSESILKQEPLIDALVDFLDREIDTAERSRSPKPHGIRIQELKAWRESTSRLAQLLCQSIE
jgi:hypothetical protein